MKALQITEYGSPFTYGDAPQPKAGPGEVLLEVSASGLCSTDLHLAKGVMDLGVLPRIPGHEVAGRVAELGAGVTGWRRGDRVTVALDVTCGRCRHCLSGQTQRCPHKQRIGFERDGGHADLVSVPAANLVALPDGVSDEAGAILPDAVACMIHALNSQGRVGVGQKVVIAGVGGLGIHGVQLARLAGAAVLATSRRPERLALAKRFGALAVNPSVVSLAEAVADFTDGDGADVVADCIGTSESVREGLLLLRPGGKLLVIAYLDSEFVLPSIPLFAAEREIVGCRGSTLQDLRTAVNLVTGRQLEPVIGATYALEQFAQAVSRLEEGRVVGRIVLSR